MVNLDANKDQCISLDEFSDQYVEIIKKLRYRQIETEDRMLESYEQFKHVQSLQKALTAQQDMSF